MKNILFISDAFLGGGLETRLLEQTKSLKSHKINGFLLCRECNQVYANQFVKASDALTVKPSSESISVQNIIDDVNTICEFCTKNKIDYIDCHPFWCALPAALAANKLHLPISFTLHGEISANFISKDYLAAQSLYDLIFSYGFDQLFAVAEYLTNLYSYLPNISIVRNGLSLDNLTKHSFNQTNKVAIASRLDEPKAKLIIDFLPELYASEQIQQIDIYGDGDYATILQHFIASHHFEDKVKLRGWINDFAETLSKGHYMLVFGMGRVVLEALKSSVPVGVLGYGGFAGLINHDNLLDFSKSNLTSWQKSSSSLSDELNNLINNPKDYFFTAKQLSIFNNTIIWNNYLETIQGLSFHDKPILSSLNDWLLNHPNRNIYDDEELLLHCVRSLSDGGHPISSRLYYNTFQYQFDHIYQLNLDKQSLIESNTKLQRENSLSLSKIVQKRVKDHIRRRK